MLVLLVGSSSNGCTVSNFIVSEVVIFTALVVHIYCYVEASIDYHSASWYELEIVCGSMNTPKPAKCLALPLVSLGHAHCFLNIMSPDRKSLSLLFGHVH